MMVKLCRCYKICLVSPEGWTWPGPVILEEVWIMHCNRKQQQSSWFTELLAEPPSRIQTCKHTHPPAPSSAAGLQFSVRYLVSCSLCAGTVWSKGSSCVWWRLPFFLISPQLPQKCLLFDVSPSSTFCLLSSIFPLLFYFLYLLPSFHLPPKESIRSRWRWW